MGKQKGSPRSRLTAKLVTVEAGLSSILIVLFIALAVVGYLYYQNQGKSAPAPQQIPQPSPTTAASPTQTTSAETANPDSIGANWKTYIHGSLTFKHPFDWIAKDFDYSNSVIIENMKSSIKITVSEGQYPYGFEGPGPMNIKENPIKITVSGKVYQTTEKIIEDKKAYVDLELDTPQKHHILFGTGYPADDDLHISLEDYYASKDTILKILSTFKFQ